MTQKDGIRGYLMSAVSENVSLKVVSILCALALYAFIHGAENGQRTFSVGVLSRMPSESANRQLLTPLPTEIGITLRGSHTQLDDLHNDDIGSVRLDLHTGRESQIDLDASMFHIPPGLAVEQIIPSSIKIRWDDVIERQIAVQVSRTGELAPGFMLKGAITTQPPTVKARGPRTVIDVMQFARAAPFDVTGMTEGISQHPIALDKPPNLVTYDTDTVAATVEIARELKQKQFPKLKVEVVGLPRATTRPPTVEVDVTGTAEEVNGILAEAIVPRVELKDIDTRHPGSAMVDVVVEIPRVNVDVKPAKVLVTW